MVKKILLLSCLFALCVVMLGAYTRLTNAGLGCPDWPGCYGHMLVKENVVEGTKAWTEMIHRYFAGTLGLFIAGLTIASFFNTTLRSARGLFVLISGLVIFQAALGMWTVTWKLHPTVVMGHLLGGLLIFTLLWLAYLKVTSEKAPIVTHQHAMKIVLRIAVLLVFLQIALGGWTSANYAAMACTDFPTCREMWWPTMHFKEAFQLSHPIGANYEGGVFSHDVRVTIQFMHRLGALVVTTVLLALILLGAKNLSSDMRHRLRPAALTVLGLLGVQVTLGISNVLFLLPLPIAVLHNGVAALLLASTVTLCFRVDHLRRPYAG